MTNGGEAGSPRVKARVPASTANLGPGFDALGMAFELYAEVEMSASERETHIRLEGGNLDGLPTDKSNLVYQVAQMVFERVSVSIPELDIVYRSDIPLTRGLGSSAAAIVGALACANRLAGDKLTDWELFQIASELEGHPDNVGASLFGGVVVAAMDGGRADYIRLDPPPALEAIVVVPKFELSTEKARRALPQSVSLADAVFNLSHSSLLVAAFASGKPDMIRHAMKDRLHEPYRTALVPGLSDVLRGAADHGALGAALSGAGPTVLALFDGRSGEEARRKLEAFLIETMGRQGIECELMSLRPSTAGVHLSVMPTSVEEGRAKV